MFQDDRMIPVLSAFVLMITLGTFLQRLDVVDRWLGGGDARPALVLLDDQAVTTAGTLLRMDVLANDEGVSNEMRQGLTIVSGPGCGRIYVRDGALEYLPGSDCVGQHIIRYGLEGAGDDKVAAVIARVHPGGNSVARATRVRAGEEPRMVARHDEAAALPDLGPPNGARGDGVLAQRTGGTAGATVGWQGDGSAGATGAGPQVDAAPPSMASAGNAAPYLAPTGLAMNAPHPETAARGTSAVGTGAADGLDGAQTDRPLADAAAAHARPAAALDSDLAKLRGHPAQTDRAAAAGERCPAADFGGSPDVAATADALHVAAVGAPPAAPALVHAGGTAAAGSAAPVAGVVQTDLARSRTEPSANDAAAAPGVPADIAEPGSAAGAEAWPRAGDRAVADAGVLAPWPAGIVPAAGQGLASTSAGGDTYAAAGGDEAAPGSRAQLSPAEAVAMLAPAGDRAAPTDRPVPAGPTRLEAGQARTGTLAAMTREGEVGLSAGAAAKLSALGGAALPSEVEPERPAVRLASLVPMDENDEVRSLPSLTAVARGAPELGQTSRLSRGPTPGTAGAPPLPQMPRAAGPSVSAPDAPEPGAQDESPRMAAAAGGPAYLLSVIGAGDAPTTAGRTGEAEQGAGRGRPEGARLASLAPTRLEAPLGVAQPLPLILPPEPYVPSVGAGIPVPRPAPRAGLPGTPEAAPVAAVAARAGPCEAVPATTLEIHGAGETVLGLAAPCQAGTVARIAYSGMNLAVPLDADGMGAVRLLGFEPVSPAVLSFTDGTRMEFELPFKGVKRISRVALAWDAPVELALNALENNAEPQSSGHVRPGATRSFEEVRRKGGGYLSIWWPVAGVGQSVQVYSWYHRSGERAGVVRMLVDFVSRDRDRLSTTCGTGREAAPEFMVLRSNAGQLERPVVRRIAPLDCGEVAEAGDKRLISGAVEDLVIMSR